MVKASTCVFNDYLSRKFLALEFGVFVDITMTEFGTSHLSMQGTWVRSLVRELGSHMPRGNLRMPCATTRETPVQCSKEPVCPKFKNRKVV